MMSAKMIRFLNENELKSVQTTTHVHTVERFIIAFNDNLYRILDALNYYKTKWITHTYNIINQYNATEHRTTQTKPNEAGKKETTFGLTGIFKMQPNIIENTLI